MPVKITVQEPLRKLLDNQPVVEMCGSTVGDIFRALRQRYPYFVERMTEPDGSVRRFVNVYVNEEDIRFLQNQQTAVQDGDEIRIIPSIAGG